MVVCWERRIDLRHPISIFVHQDFLLAIQIKTHHAPTRKSTEHKYISYLLLIANTKTQFLKVSPPDDYTHSVYSAIQSHTINNSKNKLEEPYTLTYIRRIERYSPFAS